MHRSSDTLGAALAKAQGELGNPEKSLTATIRSPFPREEGKTKPPEGGFFFLAPGSDQAQSGSTAFAAVG